MMSPSLRKPLERDLRNILAPGGVLHLKDRVRLTDDFKALKADDKHQILNELLTPSQQDSPEAAIRRTELLMAFAATVAWEQSTTVILLQELWDAGDRAAPGFASRIRKALAEQKPKTFGR